MKTLFNFFKKTVPSIELQIEGWTDVQCLENFMKFIPRVGIGTEFIQDIHGFFTHEVLHIKCGDLEVTSPPLMLDWPLEPVAFPEMLTEKMN